MPMFLVHFVLGILLAKHFLFFKQKYSLFSKPLKIGILALGALLYTYRFSVHPYFPHLINENRIWYITGLASMILIFMGLYSMTIQKILLHPVLIFLGKISYSVYLIHFVILLSFTTRFMSLLHGMGIQDENGIRFLGFIFLTAFTVLFSTLSYYGIEKPCIQLGKRILIWHDKGSWLPQI